MLTFSEHGQWRAAQRNVSEEEVQYVMEHGQRRHCAGALIVYLRKRDVPRADRASARRMRLAGTAVVLSKDGATVVTIWRNVRNGLKRIKHKSKRTLRVMENQTWMY